MKANDKNTIFVVPKGTLSMDGLQGDGYKVYSPYIEVGIFKRIVREICFKCPILPHKIWFNKSICNEHPDYIIVTDILIIKDYLIWISELFPKAQLNFTYANLVGKARHLLPNQIPSGWRIWTYDDYDSRKYGLRLSHANPYNKSFIIPKETPIYDVLFVGKDKGRGDYLLQLEKKMISLGLRTRFIITSDGKLSRRKSYHQKPIPYRELIKLVVKSRAILNVTAEGLEGITVRDLEALFFHVKLLTTNLSIKATELYYPENVFFINGLNIEELPRFMAQEMVEVPESVREMHTMEHYLEVITGMD